MHLDFSVLAANVPMIFLFVVFRAPGKTGGAFLGGVLAHASSNVNAIRRRKMCYSVTHRKR